MVCEQSNNHIKQISDCLACKKNLKLITFVIVATISLNTGITATYSASTIPNKDNCTLKVDVAHLSTNTAQKGRGSAVKVKARTFCDHRQENTQISIKIDKEGLFADHGSKTFLLTSEKKSGRVVEHKTAEIPCVNGKLTKFYGEAKATVNINGELIKLGPSYSDYIVPLCCGT